MLELLDELKVELPALLVDAGSWQSLRIDYHPPLVNRLWREWRDYRVYLHIIYPCSREEALFHPHPWPSAMEIVSGKYEMTVGYGEENNPPPVASIIELLEGAKYEMTNINSWHLVRPLDGPSASIMIAGKPWNRQAPKSDRALEPLHPQIAKDLLDYFRLRLGYKYNALSHDVIEVARHTGHILGYYAALAHVVKCGQCQKRLDDIYRGRYLSID